MAKKKIDTTQHTVEDLLAALDALECAAHDYAGDAKDENRQALRETAVAYAAQVNALQRD